MQEPHASLDARAPRARLRQAVLVASDLERTETELRQSLGLGEPFRDPGVGLFGLRNAVFALGDCFLEVVSPIQPDTAAGRYLERHGDGGYMAIFDLEDLDGARARARALGVRAVWEIDLPDMSTTHLHPADMRGAIVSIDRSRPYGSWRWGGPQWTARIGRPTPGRLAGIALAVGDPAQVAARWAEVLGRAASRAEVLSVAASRAEVLGVAASRAEVLGVAASRAEEGVEEKKKKKKEEWEGEWVLRLDGGEVRLRAVARDRREGLVEIALEADPAAATARGTVHVNGVCLRLL